MLNRDSARKRVKTPPLLSQTPGTCQTHDHLLHIQLYQRLVRDNKGIHYTAKTLYSLRRKARNLRKPCGANHHLKLTTPARRQPLYHLMTTTVGHGYHPRHLSHHLQRNSSHFLHIAITGCKLNSTDNFPSSKKMYQPFW